MTSTVSTGQAIVGLHPTASMAAEIPPPHGSLAEYREYRIEELFLAYAPAMSALPLGWALQEYAHLPK